MVIAFVSKTQALNYIVDAIKRCCGNNITSINLSTFNTFKLRLRTYIGETFTSIVDALYDNDVFVFGGAYNNDIFAQLSNLQLTEMEQLSNISYDILLALFAQVYSDDTMQ